MKHHSKSLKPFVRISMLTALAAVLTMFPQIPVGNGYVHFGDCIIYITAIFFGPLPAAIVGAIGHALADLISGYAIYAIPTLWIKGILGFVTGKIVFGCHTKPLRLILAAALSFVIVSGGYFLTELLLYGLETALLSLLFPMQWVMSILASGVLVPIMAKIVTKL